MAEPLEGRRLLAGTASIAGLVWNDLDGDGSRGVSEPGASSITVYLDLNDNKADDAGEPTQVSGAGTAVIFSGISRPELMSFAS